MTNLPAVIVAGPTASGKSALALELARRLNGTIINADSMQLYRELRILTARPTPAEEAQVPHRLYGVRPAGEPGSAAWWRCTAQRAMNAARAEGRRPILCGGSGLYFSALLHGLAEIPDVGPLARAEARALLAELGPVGLHTRLLTADPVTAVRLRPGDSQRIARAWEVWRGTGRGLAAWQADQPVVSCETRFAAILLDPPRADLRAAIAARFAGMIAEGAVEEVRHLLTLGLDPALPAMRAHGVPELSAHLQGRMTLDDAAQRAVLATGRYTRRQATWFRHHPLADPARTHTIHARIEGQEQLSERNTSEIIKFIREAG
ncbi:MAG TPA: tRNA (adenosine(37)-N6)-dimethylallyltransferase MiaA [Acetobacteraceae bacterium]